MSKYLHIKIPEVSEVMIQVQYNDFSWCHYILKEKKTWKSKNYSNKACFYSSLLKTKREQNLKKTFKKGHFSNHDDIKAAV